MEIGERSPPGAPLLLESIPTHTEVGVIAGGVFSNEAVDRLLVTLVPDLLEKLPHQRFVGFSGHDNSPGSEAGIEQRPTQEVDKECRGDDVEGRMDLPSLAARQLYEYIADEAGANTVGDA